MDILSFQEARRCDAVLLGDAPIARAMEMLWQAHRYAMHVGMNPWDFAIEINEFYRADVCNSELRWILSQGYADHASETSSGAEKRQFHGESSSMSLSETSCFIIAKAGLAFVESWYAAGPLATFNASMPRMLWPTPAGASNDAGERRSADLEKPAWDGEAVSPPGPEPADDPGRLSSGTLAGASRRPAAASSGALPQAPPSRRH
jgi:hypothetical protein